MIICLLSGLGFATVHAAPASGPLPIPLDFYASHPDATLGEELRTRAVGVPFNLVATGIFLLAILHTFLTARFRHWAHAAEERHARDQAVAREAPDFAGPPGEVSFGGQMLHFLGEVEAVFGIWAVVLAAAITWYYNWDAVLNYLGREVNFTEPMFVVVIMAIAGTRPVLRAATAALRLVASLGRRSVGAWWMSILVLAPLLGSFITEPAAMTIGALLLARKFYVLKPSRRFSYATVGLLFVNVSVGGTLTHFAAPPVLMVAAPWHWNTSFMFFHFGWKAALGIVAATAVYFVVFRGELARMNQARQAAAPKTQADDDFPVPAWITLIQLGFMAFTVMVAHYPPLFIGGFLFFLAFSMATQHHQGTLELRGPLLVGFFLAGLVIHGGLQAWWIEPVLSRLKETPLFLSATVLTAFNDNAAITYLATLVPGFTEGLKYAVVAGAVTGGGLTVIANAPNPAGQNILQRFFPDGISPIGLLLGALGPTLIMIATFLLL